MLKYKLKPGLIIVCMALILLFSLNNNVSAKTISLNGLLGTDIWDDEGNWNWELEKTFSISSNVTGIDIGEVDQVLYTPYLKFEFVTTAYSTDTGYSGSFFITDSDDPDAVYLEAVFDSLALTYMEGVFISFETSNVSIVSNDLLGGTLSDMAVSITNGCVAANIMFTGAITLTEESSTTEDDPIANPEPGTFFLLGFGMLGLARLYRRKTLT